jgi:hypothetical protein
VKVTIVVNEAGKVIAAHVPMAPETPPDSAQAEVDTTRTEIRPSEGQEVLQLEIPDEDVRSAPQPDFLDTLQRHKDGGSPHAG